MTKYYAVTAKGTKGVKHIGIYADEITAKRVNKFFTDFVSSKYTTVDIYQLNKEKCYESRNRSAAYRP